MERNPKKTKAFIVTFILVFILLLVGYFLFFGGADKFTKSISSIQKTFSPLLGSSKTKDINTAPNGGDVNTTDGTQGADSGSGDNGSGGDGSSTGGGDGITSGGNNGNNTTGGGSAPSSNGKAQCSDGIDNDGRNGKDIGDPSCHTDGNEKNINSYNPNGALEYDFTTLGFGSQYALKLNLNKSAQCSDWVDTNKNGVKDLGDKGDNDNNGLIDDQDPGCWGDRTKPATYNPNDQLELDFTPQCSDGIDNDKKNGKDNTDPGCHTDGDATNASSYDPNDQLELYIGGDIINPIPQCSDGLDNDGKNGKDTLDPGCWGDRTKPATYNPNDQLELDFTPQCSDGKDNDSKNGKDIDDKGCHTDGDENNAASYDPNDQLELYIDLLKTNNKAQCADAIDNDGKNGADINDPSCHTDNDANNALSYNPDGALEFTFSNILSGLKYTPQCSDGIDNDKNGKADENDASCHTDNNALNPNSYDENGALEFSFSSILAGLNYTPQCSDTVDNDGKNGADINDPSCHTDYIATNTRSYNPNGSLEYDFSSILSFLRPKTQCNDGIDNDGDGDIDVSDAECHTDKDATNINSYDESGYSELGLGRYIDACTVSLMKTQLITNQADIDKLETAAVKAYNDSFIIKAGTRGVWPLVKKGGGATGPIGTGATTVTECSDGADNDANGLKDSSDASCHTDGNKYNTSSYSKTITKEINAPLTGNPMPDCSDGADNDGNGLVDDKDPGCWANANNPKTYTPNDNYEKIEITECNDGIDNDGNKVIDSKDPACWESQKDSSTYNPNRPYENLVGSITLPHPAYTKTTVTVQTKNGNLLIPIILLGIYPGNNIPVTPTQINAYLSKMGYDKQAVDSTGKACFPPIIPECNDKKDNDSDGLVDRSDPGCHVDNDPAKAWDKTKNFEYTYNIIVFPPSIPACSDLKDNDGDKLVDTLDPGCHTDLDATNATSYDPTKVNELNFIAACSDGADNDKDGLADEKDPGCHSDLNPNNTMTFEPNKTSELNFIPDCRDGKDNDGDGLRDELDPGCHTDLNPSNNGPTPLDPNKLNTYNPDGYSELNFIPQCSDGIDNDKNKVKDDLDPGCYTDLKITKNANGTVNKTNYDPNKSLEFTLVPQCADGKDNDGKNGIDASDPGCWTDQTDPSTYDPEDLLELEFKVASPQCSDRLDNDKDGLTDALDPECSQDYVPKVPECSDGIDNDNDLWVDKIDPDCLQYGGNPPANMANDIWLPNKLYEDPKNNKKYDPKYFTESDIGACVGPLCGVTPTPPLQAAGNCVDVPLTFTESEKAQLDALTREFNLLSATLKTEADIVTEKDKQKQYEDLTKLSTDLTKQCIDQKKLATYKGPKEMIPNPYYSGPGYLAALSNGVLASKIGATDPDTQKNLSAYLKTLSPAGIAQYLPSYSYIHSDSIYGYNGDEKSSVDINWDYWKPFLGQIGHWDYWNYQCNDGIDNDGDGKTDYADPQCNNGAGSEFSATNNLPMNHNHFMYHLYTNEMPVPPECNDGVDNDGDGYTDDQDEGCYIIGGPSPAVQHIRYDFDGKSESNDIESSALPPTDHHYKVNPSVKLTKTYDSYGNMDTFQAFGQSSTYYLGWSGTRPTTMPIKYWKTLLQMNAPIDCLQASPNTGFGKGGNKGINDKCNNQPKFGLYDIKEIVDGAWYDFMDPNRPTAQAHPEHIAGHLTRFEIDPINYAPKNPMPTKDQADKGLYDIRPSSSNSIGLWGILNMYAGNYYNNTNPPTNLKEDQFGQFCNWEPDVTNKGNPTAKEGDNIIAHNDPHDRNLVACAFMKGMLDNFGKLETMDIRDLKRQVDDIVYKVKDAPDEELYWGTARPMLDFEQSFKIW